MMQEANERALMDRKGFSQYWYTIHFQGFGALMNIRSFWEQKKLPAFKYLIAKDKVLESKDERRQTTIKAI